MSSMSDYAYSDFTYAAITTTGNTVFGSGLKTYLDALHAVRRRMRDGEKFLAVVLAAYRTSPRGKRTAERVSVDEFFDGVQAYEIDDAILNAVEEANSRDLVDLTRTEGDALYKATAPHAVSSKQHMELMCALGVKLGYVEDENYSYSLARPVDMLKPKKNDIAAAMEGIVKSMKRKKGKK